MDNRFTGGRISQTLARTENYLMNEKHPVVLVRFLLFDDLLVKIVLLFT